MRPAPWLLLLALLLVLAPATPAAAQQPPEDRFEEPWHGGEDGFDEVWEEPEPAATPTPAPVPTAIPSPSPAPTLPAADPWREPEPVVPAVPIPKGRTIAGKVARVRADGKAAIPRGAPRTVRTLIRAANAIVGKPYKWGGAHARLIDSGYDCSGAVSYALIGAGLLRSPQVSGALARYGSGSAGRYVTVYANRGHVYLEVAGLRLDTSPNGDPSHRDGVRWRPVIGKRRGFAARHPAGL